MDFIFSLVVPHLDAVAVAVAAGIAWLLKRTETKADDDFVEKVAEKTAQKLKETE